MGIWSQRCRLWCKTKKSMETYIATGFLLIRGLLPRKKQASSLPVTGDENPKDKQFVWKNRDMAFESVSTCRKKCCLEGKLPRKILYVLSIKSIYFPELQLWVIKIVFVFLKQIIISLFPLTSSS